MTDRTPHILGTSANLLGFCAVLVTGLRFTNLHLTTLLDEILVVTSFFFLISCILSYLSIRSRTDLTTSRFENLADYFFLVGLSILFVSMVLLSLTLL